MKRYVNWMDHRSGSNIKKKINIGPTYCPSCCTFRNGETYIIKKVFGLFKKREYKGTISYYPKAKDGYYDKFGNHYCGKCNHIVGISYSKKPIKIKDSKRVVEPCSVCKGETFCDDNSYHYKTEELHIDCFMKKYPNLKIDWNMGWY